MLQIVFVSNLTLILHDITYCIDSIGAHTKDVLRKGKKNNFKFGYWLYK